MSSARHGGSIQDELVRTLETEVRLLERLQEVLVAQRNAVVMDDLQGVGDSVHRVERILLTQREARTRRGMILERLVGSADLRVGEIVAVLGADATPELADACDGLRRLARSVSRDLKVNSEVLRRSKETGDRMVRAMYGQRKPTSYGPGTGLPMQERAGSGALLVNQRI
jgi:hypothetical protein